MSKKERPILFKPEMVRAILEGRKTQTRRVVKGIQIDGLMAAAAVTLRPSLAISLCPYGVVGDRLWVREVWSIAEKKFDPEVSRIVYRADGVDPLPDATGRARWRPSIHMPRAASRLTLEVTEVRIERLHDISEEDARAEGVRPDPFRRTYTAINSFHVLWIDINGIDSWDSNPWVWVICFKKV
jgi:hypothetical protein